MFHRGRTSVWGDGMSCRCTAGWLGSLTLKVHGQVRKGGEGEQEEEGEEEEEGVEKGEEGKRGRGREGRRDLVYPSLYSVPVSHQWARPSLHMCSFLVTLGKSLDCMGVLTYGCGPVEPCAI